MLAWLQQPAVTLEAASGFRWERGIAGMCAGRRRGEGGCGTLLHQQSSTFWPTLQAADLTGDGRWDCWRG
ncbi:hypothetical protein ACFFLM_06965 [Deinococcus oregonensis]|uniref:Uncharacterized protein n=1 Tax=Deinococcus oregonensis TaxID=1805970 RepID=A0ABV6AYM0_9DEIO